MIISTLVFNLIVNISQTILCLNHPVEKGFWKAVENWENAGHQPASHLLFTTLSRLLTTFE